MTASTNHIRKKKKYVYALQNGITKFTQHSFVTLSDFKVISVQMVHRKKKGYFRRNCHAKSYNSFT
jgi:hypothetical protein